MKTILSFINYMCTIRMYVYVGIYFNYVLLMYFIINV